MTCLQIILAHKTMSCDMIHYPKWRNNQKENNGAIEKAYLIEISVFLYLVNIENLFAILCILQKNNSLPPFYIEYFCSLALAILSNFCVLQLNYNNKINMIRFNMKTTTQQFIYIIIYIYNNVIFYIFVAKGDYYLTLPSNLISFH